jgi:AcrR family transcriptional regulator
MNGVRLANTVLKANIVRVKYTVRTMAQFDLPLPPWQRAKLPPKPRPALSLDAIVATALRLLDEGGIEALSMRRVAEELGTGAASLYAYVANKEELLEHVLDRVIGEIELPAPDPSRWTEQVKEGVRGMRRVLSAHRDVARFAMARIPTRANALQSMERFIAVLRAGGLPDQVVAYAADILPLYATSTAFEESMFMERFGGEEAPDFGAFIDQLREYFAGLPRDRFPNLVELAGPLTRAEGDDRFEFGLDLLVRGLQTLATPQPAGARPPAP